MCASVRQWASIGERTVIFVGFRIGKLMLFGAIFRCLDSALTIAASLSSKSPFVSVTLCVAVTTIYA